LKVHLRVCHSFLATHRLLKLKKFTWSTEAQEASLQLKQTLTTTPMLHLPNFYIPFVVETDASNITIGIVLSQNTLFHNANFSLCQKNASNYKNK